MAAQGNTNSATGSASGTRSARSGTPVSARAAVRKPADTITADDDDAKAELQARLDDLQEKLQQTELAFSDSQKHSEVLQIKLDDALKEQGMLEENVHEHTEQIEELVNEKRESLRARRELEQIYEAERAATMKEREETQAREEEMQGAMQRMKETLAQREIRERAGLSVEDERRPSLSRTSSMRSNEPSPNPDGRVERQFAPSSSLQRSDSRSSSRLVMQKDKIIEGLRLELAEAQIKLVELENQGGGRLHQLEKDMYDAKIQNARLMEENESFQLLLSEKTLNGDLAQSDLLRAPSPSRPQSSSPGPAHRGQSLADELQDDESVDAPESAGGGGSAEGTTKERRLQSEVNSLKDQNKALTLYINNIISRLLQHEQFEQILDQTPDLMAGPGAVSRKFMPAPVVDTEKELPPPPPPPPKDDVVEPTAQQQSLLQRAGSVLRGRGTKPLRPGSQFVDPQQMQQQLSQPRVDEQPTLHENPETAPRIPLGRSASTRGDSGHRRSRSDWPAASVVTNMYKGPPPSTQAPLSPGLSSPQGRSGGFFNTVRTVSGTIVPTIEEGEQRDREREKENHQPSLVPRPSSTDEVRSTRNSVTSNPSDIRPELEPSVSFTSGASGAEVTSSPSSPPRSTTSSGDRDPRPSGAVMMGSKPRPLRLVQEAAHDDEKAKKAANRGSWFGWMNKGGAGGPPGGGGGGFGGFMPGRSGSEGWWAVVRLFACFF